MKTEQQIKIGDRVTLEGLTGIFKVIEPIDCAREIRVEEIGGDRGGWVDADKVRRVEGSL